MNLPSFRMLSIEFNYPSVSQASGIEILFMYLHAVRVELSGRRDTSELLDFDQAFSQSGQLVVDR
jgi:hypothetical protein